METNEEATTLKQSEKSRYLAEILAEAELRNTTELGLTALHLVARTGEKERAADLIRRGINKDARDSYGRTALHLAASDGQMELVRLLIDEGAQIDIRDSEGFTAEDFAKHSGHHHIGAFLAAKRETKAKVQEGLHFTNGNGRGDHGNTPSR